MAEVTREWLETVFAEPIEDYTVTSGSNPGDGYSSVLHAIEVTFPKSSGAADEGKRKRQSPFNVLLKCYPVHPIRQQFLSAGNLFQKELLVYNTIIPELIRFQKKAQPEAGGSGDENIIRPPFPDFIYGKAVDYRNLPTSESRLCTNPLDNCIVMPDLRKEGGFRLADRLTGFDLAHCELVVKAQAKVHALGWAYKLLTKTDSFRTKFPSLVNTFFDDIDDAMLGMMMDNNYGMFRGAVEGLPEDDPVKADLLTSLIRQRKLTTDVIALWFSDSKTVSDPSLTKDSILRVPQPSKENEEPWLLLCHGDSWLNNMMFRYDETGKPEEVILVDLQIVREGDPMTDLVYSIYTSTTAEFRKAHLDDLLKLYCLTFIRICEHFQVAPLPGFQLSELRRRFNRARIFGFLMCVVGLPLFLSDPTKAKDLDTMKTDMTPEELAEGFYEMTGSKDNARLHSRIINVVKDLYAEGVI